MTEIAVWAPYPKRVRVATGETVTELTAATGGWWRATVSGTVTDYAFLLDDDPTGLPDPRSAWQPNGVHAASRRYDHDAFDWTDQSWRGRSTAGAVIYELHIGTFDGGTFDAAIERLDHLVWLGVDLVEVLPVNSFDGVAGWGYDGVAWGAVHEPYGGPDGFKRFVDACHARGLGVVLDVVYNHLGPSGAYLDRFGPYFAGRNIWGPSLNLDGPDSDEVRRYVIDNALCWLRDFHVDALRLDAVHALADRRAVHILEELAIEVDALSTGLGRALSLIAESDLNDPRLISSRADGGYGLAAQWSDDLHHALHWAVTGEAQGYYADFASWDALVATLRRAFFHADTWSSFRRRRHGRPVPVERVGGEKFVVCLQNHDQIGNRAVGDRMSATASADRIACAATILLCGPYTPMLFMGEEWAASTPWQFFSSFPDPELARRVREGRFEEFAEHGWGAAAVPDPGDPATVERSRLRWAELAEPAHAAVLANYQALIALRHQYPALADPRLSGFTVEAGDRWLIMHRGDLRVAVNMGSAAKTLAVHGLSGTLHQHGDVRTGPDTVTLGPDSAAVLATA